MPGPKYLDPLYDVAAEHDGYFTVVEAKQANVPARRVSQMARRGTIERVGRGLYRLRNFPILAERAQLWEAVLWAQQRKGDPLGVLSHQTALAFWGLSDVSPMSVHITLPLGERLRRSPPPVMKVHFAELEPEDTTSHDGLPITTVRRSIIDCIKDGELRYAAEALDDALRNHLLTKAQARELKRQMQ